MASARQIRDEIMKMTIVVNSDPAQKAIHDLSTKNVELKERNKEVRESMEEVRKTAGKQSKEYKDLSAELKNNTAAISANQKEMERLRGEMDITQMTMAQLKKEAALLRNNLANMVPGSEASRALQEQLDAVNARMAEVRTGAQQSRMSFSQLADKFNQYSGMVAAGAAVLVGFGMSVQNVIDRNNKMADAMSGVEKNVNMTKREVQELARSFSDLDTRTGKLDLLKIAEAGGKLGVSKDQIKDFVTEVDKANVALGDSWEGGAGKIAESIGKVTTLYKQTSSLPIAESINQIGSALNELAADGAASEANINDFATRLGAMPDKLKPAIHEALGLGAAFEESGIDAERAGTAYSNFIAAAAKDANGFAEVMRRPVAEVKNLINTNPTEFFLQFSEGLKGLDATELATVLDHLKLNDQYVKSILGAASEKTARFREQIDLANTSMRESTSLQNEFNKVNNNAAGIWEKVQRKMAEALSSKGIAEFINACVTAFGKFLGVVEDTNGAITDFRTMLVLMLKVIAIATVTTLSYNAAVALAGMTMQGAKSQLLGYTIVQKANNVLTQIGTVLQTAWNLISGTAIGIVGNLTRSTVLQTAAQQRLNLALSANPWGAILAVITLVISAYIAFGREADEITKKQLVLNDVRAQAASAVAKEKSELQSLLGVAQNENLSKQQRLDAIKRLNAISPEYLGNLTLENIKTQQATDAIKAYISMLDRKAMAEAFQVKRTDLMKKMIDESGKSLSDYAGFGGVAGQKVEQFMNGLTDTKKRLRQIDFQWWDKLSGEAQQVAFKNYDYTVQRAIIEHNKLINGTKDELSALNKMEADFLKNNPDVNAGGGGGGNYKHDFPKEDKGDGGRKAKSEADRQRREEERKKREEEQYQRQLAEWKGRAEDAAQHARQNELDIEDAKIAAMKEGYDKEIDELRLQEQRKLAEIDRKKVGQSDFDKLDAVAAKAKGGDKKLFEALRQSWLKNNEDLETLKEEQSEIFHQKRLALQYKNEHEWLQEKDSEHTKEIGQLQRQMNEELANIDSLAEMKQALQGRVSDRELSHIKTWEDGKQALQKLYHKQELELNIAHLDAMVKLYEGMDLTALTEDQRKKVLGFIDEAKNKIAEFKAAANGEEQMDGKKKYAAVGKDSKFDALGLNQDDWVNLINNIHDGTNALGIMQAAVTALSNAFSIYYASVEANEKRQLQTVTRNANTKKLSLKHQLETGLIDQETFKKETLKVDREVDKKKAELEMKAARRQRQMQIAQAIAGTAMAVINAANTQPFMPVGLAMMAVAGIAGAIQIATIMNTPLPTSEGYEAGFNTLPDEYPITREQDGKKFTVRQKRLRSGPVDRPTHFIAGERGLEMVIDAPTWTSYSPELKSAIYTANARAKGFEDGFNTIPRDASTKNPDTGDMLPVLIQLVRENNEVMQSIKDYGIKAYIEKSARNGKEIHEMTEQFLDLNNKNKH